MQISELARQAGTTTKAVRFCGSLGLLRAPERASELAALCSAGHCERVSTELRERIARQRADIRRRTSDPDYLDRRPATLERHLAAGAGGRDEPRND